MQYIKSLLDPDLNKLNCKLTVSAPYWVSDGLLNRKKYYFFLAFEAFDFSNCFTMLIPRIVPEEPTNESPISSKE